MTKTGFYPALNVLAKQQGHLTSEIAAQGRQCLCCQSYLEFRYPEGGDYGVCLNRESAANGQIVFEHFGCKNHKYRKDDL